MADSLTVKLQEAIREVKAKIQRFQDRSLGEQNTKASLIEPVLEALGWDIRDPDEVHREFKPTTQDKPVDYSLTLLRKPRLFVEAKGLGEDLNERRWVGQVLGYAAVAGVEWCVLTDGNEYRLYNATVALDADEKLFYRIRLTEDSEEEAARVLKLISRSDMAENLLEVLWNAHYVDRRVKQALQEIFGTRERGLVRLIRRRVSKLTPREILDSLRRLDIRVDSPAPIADQADRPKTAAGKKARKKLLKGEKKVYRTSLAKIIAAGLLTPPVRLFRKYKGKVMEATLLPDGSVEFEGKRYKSCSTAAETARSTITGRKMNTNGWVFWQYTDTNGKTLELVEARGRYLALRAEGT